MHHICNRLDIAKKQEQEVVGNRGVPEDIVDILDVVMDYEPNDDGKTNIDNHVFNDEYEDDDADDDDAEMLGNKESNLSTRPLFVRSH